MDFLIIDSFLKVVTDNTIVPLVLIVPRANINSMLKFTNARLIDKENYKSDFYHNAGHLYKVSIDVRFGDIKQYLHTTNTFNAFDFSGVRQLFSLSGSQVFCYKDFVSLYAFGNCRFCDVVKSSPCKYYSKSGNCISIFGVGNFPRYRYSSKHGWMSNRAF